jgi:hypothetical protein
MAPPTPGTPPSEPARGAAGEPRADEHGDERFGPLKLTRVHKDDGRELIFFTDARDPA